MRCAVAGIVAAAVAGVLALLYSDCCCCFQVSVGGAAGPGRETARQN
jgi:hypothetical protein